MRLRSRSFQLEGNVSDRRVNSYDEISPVFNEAMGEDFVDLVFGGASRIIKRTVRGDAHIRHLDLACGTGLFICRLARVLPTEPYGIDLSCAQIAAAKDKAAQEGVQAHFEVGNVSTTAFPQACHLVTCNFDSLNHVRSIVEWQSLFAKIHKCLRPGGIFLFDVNTPRRLIHDWAYPEVIMKPRLTYVQCGLPLRRARLFVRRQILIQVFSGGPEGFERRSALVEQIAVGKDVLFRMLREAGFAFIQERVVSQRERSAHLFMRNRLFLTVRRAQ